MREKSGRSSLYYLSEMTLLRLIITIILLILLGALSLLIVLIVMAVWLDKNKFLKNYLPTQHAVTSFVCRIHHLNLGKTGP